MAFSIGRLQFLDSFQFTMQTLDKLVTSLDDTEFIYVREEFSNDEQFYMMKQKGVFPYDFFNDISKLTSEEEMEFPSRKTFSNKLSGKECSMNDYLHATSVWNTVKWKTFKNYHGMFLKNDILLLVDFFEKCRSTCLMLFTIIQLLGWPGTPP